LIPRLRSALLTLGALDSDDPAVAVVIASLRTDLERCLFLAECALGGAAGIAAACNGLVEDRPQPAKAEA